MADETEYYWDEETQKYYYWDEATQAYYPWEDDGCNQVTVEETVAVVHNTEDTSPTILTPLFETKPVEISTETPAGAEHYDHGRRRGSSRRMSLAEHGGLGGVLQVINDERRQRAATVKLTDEDIKAQHVKERIREMLVMQGLGDENLMQHMSDDFRDELSESATTHQTLLDTPSEKSRQSLTDLSLFRNTARGDGSAAQPHRRSSVRFGTSSFSDPTFQSRIEKMLGSSVKK